MNRTRVALAIAVMAATWCAGAVGAAGLALFDKRGKILQRLPLFDNPEGAIFSADGRYVFISSSAELGMPDKGFHWVHKGGYISKLEVMPDGTLKMLSEKLVTGLTGPLGMAVNTVATKKFPRGAIFVVESWSQLAGADGTEVRDSKLLDPAIVAFDVDGKVLGRIRLGAGTAAAKVSGVPAIMGNALAIDAAGDLFVADTGAGLAQFSPPVPTHGGELYLLPHESLDALAEGGQATVHHLTVPQGGPDGIEVAPDGMIHFNTVGLAAGTKDPAEGGMYRVSKQDFKAGKLPQPFHRGLGALDGLIFVGANRLDTEVKDTNSILVTPRSGGAPRTLAFDREISFAGPADIAARRMADGTHLLVVPELSALSPNRSINNVDVIRLPADF